MTKTGNYYTKADITKHLKRIGLKAGDTVLVHSSLSKIGWVVGGSQAVIEALLAVLGDKGTLMLPTHTPDWSEPAHWKNPPVAKELWSVIRQNMPAYDPNLTPTQKMGTIPETFRCWKDVIRSAHPIVSFAALGPNAKMLTAQHQLGSGFGENSPLARLYTVAGKVLLIGVTHANNTSLHLAEYRADFPDKTVHEEGSALNINGVSTWKSFKEQVWHDDDFADLGQAFETDNQEFYTVNNVGDAPSRLMEQQAIVDYAVIWMSKNRQKLLTENPSD